LSRPWPFQAAQALHSSALHNLSDCSYSATVPQVGNDAYKKKIVVCELGREEWRAAPRHLPPFGDRRSASKR